MTQLVPAHLERLELAGYTVLPDVLPAAEVRRAREAVEALYRTDPGVAARRRSPADAYHVEILPNKGEVFETFFLNPHVLPYVSHHLGDDFIAQDVWSFGIAPGSEPWRLHVDVEVHTPGRPLTMVTLYPLVDFTQENGGTRVVPGSHWIPYPPACPASVAEVSVEAPAGSCIVFFGSLWHASGGNRTAEIRSSMACYFTRPWIHQYIDFPRVLDPAVVERAGDEARRIYGFRSQVPTTESWQWDRERGRPRT